MCGNFFFDKVKLSRSATSLKTRFLKTRYILVDFAKFARIHLCRTRPGDCIIAVSMVVKNWQTKLNYGTKTKRRYQFEPEV